MRAKIHNDLSAVDILTVLLIVIISFSPPNVLRIILGLPFLLFFPGYTLISALFPRKSDLGGIERLALSLGLSIAVVPLTGLLLNYTPWGIRLYPILISVSVFTIAMSSLAWYRRRALSAEERINFSFSGRTLLSLWQGEKPVDRILSLLLTVAILGTVAVLVYVAAVPRVGERFTEFYILGESGKAADYPTELRIGMAGKVTVGIINQEHSEEIYRIEVRESGAVIKEVGPVTLEHEQKWEQSVEFIPQVAGENQKIEFLLFKGEAGEPYRALHLWLNVRTSLLNQVSLLR